jgi:hypothetical protein
MYYPLDKRARQKNSRKAPPPQRARPLRNGSIKNGRGGGSLKQTAIRATYRPAPAVAVEPVHSAVWGRAVMNYSISAEAGFV